MNDARPFLRQIHDLLADFGQPALIWQVGALLLCLVFASLFARRWQHRREVGGHLEAASVRLAFPLGALCLLGIAWLVLKPFASVTLLRLAMPLLASMALVRMVVFVLRQTFSRAIWLATWERLIASLIWGWLALHLTDLTPFLIEALSEVGFSIGKQELTLWMLLRGLVTVGATVVLALWLAGLIEARLMGIQTLDANLRIVSVRVAKAGLTVVAILTGLSLVGIDMTALSVFTGALGVGLGFGLQKIASNYVSGFIILLDRSIRIGNIVQVGAEAGEVTQITTRYTVLKHPGGSEFIVPNEMLIGSVVQNQTYTDACLRLSTTVGVAYDSDLDQVMQVMMQVAQEHPRVLPEPPPRVFLTQFADSAITLELGFWIDDPERGKGNVVSDINLGIWRAFRQAGIQIPFPQREVRLLTGAPTP